MIKFSIKFFSVLLFSISSAVFAGPITSDLAEDTYFSSDGYDWTWASSVNVTNYNTFIFGQGAVSNVFEDADFHTGWMEVINTVEHSNLEQLFAGLELSDFKDANGNIIHSAQYWNSTFDGVDEAQFSTRRGVKNPNDLASDFYFETFYVRVSSVDVPEPSTIFVFSLGMLALSMRKRFV